MSERPEQSRGPVITNAMYQFQTDQLRRTVEKRLREEALASVFTLAGELSEQIRLAYTRGLADGFAQGQALQPAPQTKEESDGS